MQRDIIEALKGGGLMEWLKIEGDKVVFDVPPAKAVSPEDLPKAVELVFRHFSSNKVELIKVTGRGPVWLYSAVVHAVAHLSKAVGVYSAIDGAYIVVVSHDPKYRIGERVRGGP